MTLRQHQKLLKAQHQKLIRVSAEVSAMKDLLERRRDNFKWLAEELTRKGK